MYAGGEAVHVHAVHTALVGPACEFTNRTRTAPPSPQTFGEGKDKVKVYHHHAYKMEAAAPFRICAVSREITLVTRKKSSDT